MKVLHVYRTFFPDPPGGLQEAIRQIALATRHQGALVRVFALSRRPVPKSVQVDGIEVFRERSWLAPASCDLGGRQAFPLYADLAAWADIIHFHYPWPFADVLDQWVDPPGVRVMTYHSDIVRQRLFGTLYRAVMIKTLRRMDAVVATSPAYARTSEVLRSIVPPGRLHVIPLGIEDGRSTGQEDPGVFTRIGMEGERPFILFIGVLRYYKGLRYLLEAAPSTLGRIVIAGSGPEEQWLKRRARELGVDNVHFAGRITEEEKMALLRRCRALVLPSHLRSEAFGMVLVEASMYAKPLISCELGTGTSFVNLHGETGLVVAPEQPEALAAAMNSMLEDDERAGRFGHNARRRYERFFSGRALGQAYMDLYSKLLESAVDAG